MLIGKGHGNSLKLIITLENSMVPGEVQKTSAAWLSGDIMEQQ